MSLFDDEKKEFNELLEFSENKKNLILDNLIAKNIDNVIDKNNTIDISSDVYKDTQIDKWAESLPVLDGSKKLIKKYLYNPTNNKELLLNRQLSFIEDDIDFSMLKEHENDVIWAYKLNEELNNNKSVNLLFPSYFIISYINYFTPLLDMFHLYKILFIPFTSIIFPLISIFTPLYYLNKYLKFNISIIGYIKMLHKFLKVIFKPTGNFKFDLIKIVTFVSYVMLYIYNMYQTVEYATILYNTRQSLINKMTGLVTFVKEANYIISNIDLSIISPFFNGKIINNNFTITNSMTDIYKIWKSDKIKNNLTSLLLNIYIIDIISSISKLKENRKYIDVAYNDNETIFYNMKNPLLADNQTANPVKISKNIIVTGPNAAGKTTYVKSILSNIILGQTFGIAYSTKASVVIYDTINSFMRITDVLGSKSYFESEAEYCLNMINKSTILHNNNKKGLFLMDEPMHSTPPTEGMATAYAVAEYIGKLKGINIILTTHFYKLTLLEKEYPKEFINLSVNAIPKKDGGFIFPYKIRKGHSYQCIALDLLKDKMFPDEVISSAIKMKNKIYEEINK
jgi:hypothetical protein